MDTNISGIPSKDLFIDQKDIKHNNTNSIDIVVIPPNIIKHTMKHSEPNFLSIALSALTIQKLNPDNFLEDYAKYLDIKKYKMDETKKFIIYETKNYIYELFFAIKKDGNNMEETRNDLGSLLDIESNYVFGNCILMKTDVSENMKLVDISKEDVYNLLHNRGNPKGIVCTDEDFYEDVITNLDVYKKKIFKEDRIYKKEIIICNYSLTFYFNKNEYGNVLIPGYIDTPCDYMVIVSNWTNNMRETITLEEFNMIKGLLMLKKYEFDKDIIKEKKDNLGRNIIYSKYRILTTMYNRYCKK